MHYSARTKTTSFIVLLVSVFLLSVLAGVGKVSATNMWSRTYGGTGNESAGGDIIQTSDDGYAIAGDTTSFGAGNNDYWLIKTDADGNVQWNMTYGTTGYDIEAAMCQTSDGGYALAGLWNATNGIGVGGDFGLVKTDASGNMQWSKTYGRSSIDWAVALVQTSDGGYALSGYTGTFGVVNTDGWLVKTDASGNMQWNKTYGGTGGDYAYYVVATSDGGYALGGIWNGTDVMGNGGDFWLVKTDASGNTQWNKTYGGTGTDTGMYLIQTADGGYAMVGYTNSFGAGGQDAWLVKTDSNGNMLWNKTYGGSAADQGIHVLQTTEGGYVIVGYTSSFGAGGQDAWLIKTNANGDMQWNQTYGGTGNELVWSLTLTNDGGYAIAGYTTSFGAGGQDFYVVKTDASGVVPEGLTIEVMMLLSTVAVMVGARYFRKTRIKRYSHVNL